MIRAHALLCVQGVRSLGAVAQRYAEYKHREVHMPRRAKVTSIELSGTNLQRSPCPGGQRNLLLGLKKKKEFIFRHRDYAWSVNRGREACDTWTNHGSLGYHGGRGGHWAVQAQSVRI